ncbi:MAG: zinc-binding dehydrogenase [Chloroflexota bacterium]|nr:zinc-binding dehydrogenase [Chloroflexota bacterium]
MQSAQVTALGKIQSVDIPIPQIESGELLIKTKLASICGSDLHIVNMGWNVTEYPLPHGYPGHEGIGQVVDRNGVNGFDNDDLVLTVPNIWNSKTFAEYQVLNPQYLLRLPKHTPEKHLLMAQQLGTVIFGCRRLPPLLGKTVAVIGQGSVGLFHDFMLKKLGAHRIIAIEPLVDRLDAGKKLGVDDSINVIGNEATQYLMDLTSGEGADVVIEAVGSVETLNQAIHLAKPFGRVALFGLPSTMDMVPFDWDAFFRKKLVAHSIFGAQDEHGLPAFQLAVDFITRGEIDMEPFVNTRVPIQNIQHAFNLAKSPTDGVLKVSLTF